MSDQGAWLRRIALGLLLAVLVLSALGARVVAEGEAELSRSDQAFNRADLREAVLYARRAAVLYVPGAPHVPAAYARLEAVAIGAEASGQPEVARQAWGAIRSAALETRHLLSPREAELARANDHLARLSAPPGDDAARRAEAASLARDPSPRGPWLLLLGAGAASFAAGLGVLSAWGFGAPGGATRRARVVAVALLVAGVACWTLSAYRA